MGRQGTQLQVGLLRMSGAHPCFRVNFNRWWNPRKTHLKDGDIDSDVPQHFYNILTCSCWHPQFHLRRPNCCVISGRCLRFLTAAHLSCRAGISAGTPLCRLQWKPEGAAIWATDACSNVSWQGRPRVSCPPVLMFVASSRDGDDAAVLYTEEEPWGSRPSKRQRGAADCAPKRHQIASTIL